MKRFFLCFLCISLTMFGIAQTQSGPRGITIEEYTNAKTYDITDLDNDSYAKFGNNQYIAERYEDKKPYFVTGDDGKKKRIDLYALSKKGDDFSLGLLIYYTTETGKRYIACLPNNFSPGPVWEKYFEDIHAIDNAEKFFVLKLSYILSRELSYSQYKSTLKGEDISRAEAGTYGNDICFPGTDIVSMADGSNKMLKDIVAGDKVQTVDPASGKHATATVTKLVAHEAKNYAITTLTLINTVVTAEGTYLTVQSVSATPNHPMSTDKEIKNIGDINSGEKILCLNAKTGKMETFEVWNKTEKAGGVQKVFNMETSAGETFIMNGVMVRQK